MRCFIAIDLPESIKEKIYEISKNIRFVRGKFVEKENYHITLKFLGEVVPKKVEEIINTLKNIKYTKFYISLKEYGFFPSIKSPRVLWIGLGIGKEDVIKLQREIDRRLSKLGFPREMDFVPHITILRIKNILNRKKFLESIENLKDFSTDKFIVESFKLKQSILRPEGPLYKDIFEFSLE